MDEFNWRNSPRAAGEPWGHEDVPPGSEGGPARGGELPVSWWTTLSVNHQTLVISTQPLNFSCRCNKPERPFLSCPVTCFDGKDDLPHDLQGQCFTHNPLASIYGRESLWIFKSDNDLSCLKFSGGVWCSKLHCPLWLVQIIFEILQANDSKWKGKLKNNVTWLVTWKHS